MKKKRHTISKLSGDAKQYRSYGSIGEKKLNDIVADIIVPADGEGLKFTSQSASERISNARKRNEKVPLGYKVYDSPYCAQVVRLIMHPAGLSWKDIKEILFRKFNFNVSIQTLIDFKRNYLETAVKSENRGNEWFTYEELEDIRMKAKALADAIVKGREDALSNCANVIDYLERLCIEIQIRLEELKKKQEYNIKWEGGKISTSIEDSILKCINSLADIKYRIASLTQGYDVKQLKLSVAKDSWIACSGVLMEFILQDKRGFAVEENKKAMQKFLEGVQ